MRISSELKKMLAAQKVEWELAAKNFAGLSKVQVRKFAFDGFIVKVQFNPGRIISSSAKVDKKTIEQRPCFLCSGNRPAEQREVRFGDYSVLLNPFPIFPEHFTIVATQHIPQLIEERFGDMLDLAHAMSGYTLFYNGPKCGASAPDHFHFQAGNYGFMPIDNEINFLKDKFGIRLDNRGEVWAIKDGLRNFLLLESDLKESLLDQISLVYNSIEKNTLESEPMLNILVTYNTDGRYRVLIFPRVLHRPDQYFEEGERNILLSPASADMGGLLITPLEKDFKKITKQDIEDIMHQVLMSDEDFDKLIEKIKR